MLKVLCAKAPKLHALIGERKQNCMTHKRSTEPRNMDDKKVERKISLLKREIEV